MAETLGCRNAYSLRSEIRKKIFEKKVTSCVAVNNFLEKYGAAAIGVFAGKTCKPALHCFARLDARIGGIFSIAESIV
jgi:hypothetical protein